MRTPPRIWLPVVAWALFILIVTSVPVPDAARVPAAGLVGAVVHFALYGVLGWRVATALGSSPGIGLTALALAVGVIFAAVDEAHQLLIPGRSADPVDWTVDVAGFAGAMFVRQQRGPAFRGQT